MEFRLDEVSGISAEDVDVKIEIDGQIIELGTVYRYLHSDSQIRITVFNNSENVGWYLTQINKLQKQIRVNLVHKFSSAAPYVVIGVSTTSLEINTDASPVKQFSLDSFENIDPRPPSTGPKFTIPLLQPKNTPRNSKLEKVLQELTKEYSTLQAKYDSTTQLQAGQILDLQHQLRDTITQLELNKLSHENQVTALETRHKSQVNSAELKLHALNLVIEDQKHLLISRDIEIVQYKNTIEEYREFIQKLLMLFTAQMYSSKQRETQVLKDFNNLDKENLSINRTVSSLFLKNSTTLATNTTLEQEKNIEKSYRISIDDTDLVNFLECLDLTPQIDLDSTFNAFSSIYKDIFSRYSSQTSDYFESQLEVLKQNSVHFEDIILLDNFSSRLKHDSTISNRIKSDNKDLKNCISTLLSNINKEKRKSKALQEQTSILSEDISHYRSLINQLEITSNTLKQEKQDLHAQMYDTLLKSGPIGPEQIDKILTEYLASNDYPNLFVKSSDGAYTYGSKKVGILVRNSSLIVRVGGGYMCIDEFIKVHVHSDINKSQEDSFDKLLHSPSYKNISIVRRTQKPNDEENIDKTLILSPTPSDRTYDASNAINGLRKKDLGSNLPRPSFTPKKSGTPKINLSFN